MTTHCAIMPSPVGDLLLARTDEGLTEIRFGKRGWFDIPESWERDARAFDEERRQLDAYFAGTLREFDLRLAPAGTAFQKRVWDALLNIAWGETVSYSEVARRVGKPAAVRAVGSANGSNPIPIVIPCHRVIGSDGSLTGYGGGLEAKRWLLRHEGLAVDEPSGQMQLY